MRNKIDMADPVASAPLSCSWDAFAERRGLAYGFGARGTLVPDRCVEVRQVHGVRVVDQQDVRPSTEADGVVVRRHGVVVAVRTADCVPILLVADGVRWAAAVHAGWRGTLSEIAVAAVGVAVAAGIEARNLRAAMGPAIGPCCYRVGEEVAAPFADAGHPVQRVAGAPHLDLRSINRALLRGAGLRPEWIEQVGPCVCCAHDRYYSVRGDPSERGRQHSWIGWADGSYR